MKVEPYYDSYYDPDRPGLFSNLDRLSKMINGAYRMRFTDYLISRLKRPIPSYWLTLIVKKDENDNATAVIMAMEWSDDRVVGWHRDENAEKAAMEMGETLYNCFQDYFIKELGFELTCAKTEDEIHTLVARLSQDCPKLKEFIHD